MAARSKNNDDTPAEVEEARDPLAGEPVDMSVPESLVEGSTFASRAKARNKRIGNADAVKKG